MFLLAAMLVFSLGVLSVGPGFLDSEMPLQYSLLPEPVSCSESWFSPNFVDIPESGEMSAIQTSVWYPLLFVSPSSIIAVGTSSFHFASQLFSYSSSPELDNSESESELDIPLLHESRIGVRPPKAPAESFGPISCPTDLNNASPTFQTVGIAPSFSPATGFAGLYFLNSMIDV